MQLVSDLSWDLKPGNLIPTCLKLNKLFHTSPQDASPISPRYDSSSSSTPALFSHGCSLSLTLHLNKNGWKAEYTAPPVLNINLDSILIIQTRPDTPRFEHLGTDQKPPLVEGKAPPVEAYAPAPALPQAHSPADLGQISSFSKTHLFKTWG